MLEVLDYLVICKDQESEARVLVPLSVQFLPDGLLEILDFLLIFGLLINLQSAATAVPSAAHPHRGTLTQLFIFLFYES